MIHLAHFLIGIRHERKFKLLNSSGLLVDELVELYDDLFKKVEMSPAGNDFILRNELDTTTVRFTTDDIIVDQRKIHQIDTGYVEIDKEKVLDICEDALTVGSDILKLKKDFLRIGMIFEFRLPRSGLTDEKDFGQLINEKFIQFKSPGIPSEGALRFVYKIPAPGGGAIANMKDFHNVIIQIENNIGVHEDGKKDNCLLIRFDIQKIFNPAVSKINIQEHYAFSEKHLKAELFPMFKEKGIEITW